MKWYQVYELFGEIVEEHYPNRDKINEEVKKLAESHKGEEAYDEAFRRWNETE